MFVNNIWWSAADRVLIFFTFTAVIYNIYLNRKKMQDIAIYLQNTQTDKKYKLFTLTRHSCTRSEVQGLLGNKLKKGVNLFDIDYLSTQQYLDEIRKIQQNKSKQLVIFVTPQELQSFKIGEEV